MSNEKHLVIAGHGLQPTGIVDPGASGNGTNESEFLREVFVPEMQKYAPSNVDFHTENNFFGHRLAPDLKGYDQVTELHLDWSKGGQGGHVIIYKDYSPDDVDKSIKDVVKDIVGLRGGVGFSYRDNLYNLNVFADRNITYRLVELGFINNDSDMRKIRDNVDEYARQLMEAITGETIEPIKVAEQISKPVEEKQVAGKIATIQRTLNAKYDFNIAVDNVFGPETQRALVSALQIELNKQRNANLVIDGKFGPITRRSTINVKEKAQGNITWILQAILDIKGFNLGEIDGIFGIKTRSAVKAFQGKNHLVVDGIAGAQTFQMLFK